MNVELALQLELTGLNS